MFSTYRRYRKEFAWVTQAREAGDAIQQLAEEVMLINDDPDFHAKLIALRAREQALLDSMESDIPWICKVIPIK